MNVGNNLGSAGITVDLSAAIGESQNIGGSIDAGSGKVSPFQKLISQMLTQKCQTSESCEPASMGEDAQESFQTKDLLSRLLFAEGNLAKQRVQSSVEEGLGNVDETDGQIENQSSLEGLSGESATELQDLILGLTNGLPTPLSDADVPEIMNSKSLLETINPLSDGQLSGMQALGKQQDVQRNNTPFVSMETMLGQMETLQGQTEGNEFVVENKDISNKGNSVMVEETLSTETRNSGKVIQSGEQNDSAFRSDLKLMENPMTMQVNRTENKGLEEMTSSVDESLQVIETANGIQDRTGTQNPLQGTGSVNEASTSLPIQTVEKTQAYSQIGQEVLSKLEQKGPMEFQMQLEPEDLGQIDIKLKLSDGKLIIDIIAANSKTQMLLTSQVDKLISSMGLQNVQVESIQVNQQLNSQSHDSQNQGFTMNSGMSFSQKRQQEQEQTLNQNNSTNLYNEKKDGVEMLDSVNQIKSMKYDSHRMNYAV